MGPHPKPTLKGAVQLTGTVRVVKPSGFGFIELVNSKSTSKPTSAPQVVPFSLDLVDRYDGRTPKQFGIKPGAKVQVTMKHGAVKTVILNSSVEVKLPKNG